MVAGDERVSLKDAVNRVKQRESDNFRDVFIRQKKKVSAGRSVWLSG